MKHAESIVLAFFGVFLILAGFAAFMASGYAPSAKTAILSGSLSGAIMLVCAWLYSCRSSIRHKWGRRVGILISGLLAGVFSWRLTMALLEHGTETFAPYKPIIIGAMQVASLVVFGLLCGLTIRRHLLRH